MSTRIVYSFVFLAFFIAGWTGAYVFHNFAKTNECSVISANQETINAVGIYQNDGIPSPVVETALDTAGVFTVSFKLKSGRFIQAKLFKDGTTIVKEN